MSNEVTCFVSAWMTKSLGAKWLGYWVLGYILTSGWNSTHWMGLAGTPLLLHLPSHPPTHPQKQLLRVGGSPYHWCVGVLWKMKVQWNCRPHGISVQIPKKSRVDYKKNRVYETTQQNPTTFRDPKFYAICSILLGEATVFLFLGTG